MILLSEPADMAWLLEVHLKLRPSFFPGLAILHGTEDALTRVDLYGLKTARVFDPPLVIYLANEDGDLMPLPPGFPASAHQGYVEAILFTESDYTDENPDDTSWAQQNEDEDSFTTVCRVQMLDDVLDFIETCGPELIEQYLNLGGIASQFGTDFWFTRNGHGAGFWDRGLGEVGERLTELAKLEGERNGFRHEDGQLDYE